MWYKEICWLSTTREKSKFVYKELLPLKVLHPCKTYNLHLVLPYFLEDLKWVKATIHNIVFPDNIQGRLMSWFLFDNDSICRSDGCSSYFQSDKDHKSLWLILFKCLMIPFSHNWKWKCDAGGMKEKEWQ